MDSTHPFLLVDARNTAYRSVFAGRSEIIAGIHPVTIWIRMMHYWVEKFKPASIHVFWDCKTRDVWRKSIYPEYKENRGSVYSRHTDIDIGKCLGMLESAASDILEYSNIRQYKVDTQEADDLIYAACSMITSDAVIVSGDEDLTQISRHFGNVKVYDPIKKITLDRPTTNPVVRKALMGDKSDNIPGYRGIGKVKSERLASDIKALHDFLKTTGPEIFRRNISLIDLSKNPKLEDNRKYVSEVMATPVKFDKQHIIEFITKHKIRGLLSEYHNLVTPLKVLV